MNLDYVSPFAGPGGWCQGLHQAGLSGVGIELSGDACATRRAAGWPTIQADVRDVNPRDFRGTAGPVASPPCPTFSAAGKHAGRSDYQHVLDAVACTLNGCACELGGLDEHLRDPRSGLVATTVRWIVEMQPEWVLLEQVPSLEYAWEDIAAELDGWYVDVGVLDSARFGVPQRRRRVYLIAHRTHPVHMPRGSAVETSPLDALGLHGRLGFPRRNDRGDGATYRVRDMRDTAVPAFTLTEKVRSWKLETPDGATRPLTIPEIAVLAGFPADYPFQGSRTSRCLQAANAVSPPVAEAFGRVIAATPTRRVAA